jgi:hypothetical protein
MPAGFLIPGNAYRKDAAFLLKCGLMRNAALVKVFTAMVKLSSKLRNFVVCSGAGLHLHIIARLFSVFSWA